MDKVADQWQQGLSIDPAAILNTSRPYFRERKSAANLRRPMSHVIGPSGVNDQINTNAAATLFHDRWLRVDRVQSWVPPFGGSVIRPPSWRCFSRLVIVLPPPLLNDEHLRRPRAAV